MSTTTDTELRTATLQDLATLLEAQQVRKVDAVVPAAKISAHGDLIRLEDVDAELTDTGVIPVAGDYRPTDVAIEHLADKLGIPLAYARKLYGARPDLFEANVNGWLHGGDWGQDGIDQPGERAADADPRSFLCRLFRPDDGDQPGMLRAILSDRYRTIDHLDVLTSAIEGIYNAGLPVQVQACDLTDRRMYVRIHAPTVEVVAADLLRGYRSPWTGDQGTDNPTVFAGFVLSNSETGEGSWTIAPQIVVRICTNGMTMKRDVLRQVHLGGKLDSGVIRYGEDTQAAQLELVKLKARDTVATFLDVDYVRAKVAELEAQAGVKLTDPAKTVEIVTNRLSYTEGQRADVLRMFVEGGQSTAGGVMQAVTAAAQLQVSGDTQYAMELDAVPALEYAVAAAGAS
jgi:hypothetical protein